MCDALPPLEDRPKTLCDGARGSPTLMQALDAVRLKTMSIRAYADQNHRPATVQVSMMVYLLSPEAGNMTGSTFSTDGGWTASDPRTKVEMPRTSRCRALRARLVWRGCGAAFGDVPDSRKRA